MPRFAVVGLGRFGSKVAEYLMQKGAEVLAIDKNKERVEYVKDKVTHAVILDSSDMASLKSVGVDEMDALIVGVGDDFEASVLTVALAKKLGVKRVLAKANTDIQGEVLRHIGADEVLYPEDSEARRVARGLMEPNIIDNIRITDDQSLIRVIAPSEFVGKSITDLNLRKKYGVTVLEVTRNRRKEAGASGENAESGAAVTTMPPPDYVFREGDEVVVIGQREHIEKFRKVCSK